jgi:hypothetical protein
MYEGGLISLWLYKETNKLWDWKNVFTLHISPSSTRLWLRCSNFFNPSKKNSFGCAANHLLAANFASSVLENFLPLRCLLRLGKR